jgi:predicted HicB family RNase H-like nuclease
MAKRVITENAEVLLTLARKLAETPGMTWVALSNAIYGPGGPFVRFFPTKADRIAFGKTRQSRQIDDLLEQLPEPPVTREPKRYSGKFNVRIPKALHAALANEAEAEGVSINQLVLAKLALRLKTG